MLNIHGFWRKWRKMSIMYNKYKDEIPERTIERIQEIYKKIGLKMDYTIDKHVDGIFSAYIQDHIVGWNTAGKGTTFDFCLASAYGESIEHICNHFAFDISKTSSDAKEHLGFLRYPDEILMPISEVTKVAPDVFRDMLSCFDNNGEEVKVDSVWEDILGMSETPYIPYYNITQEKEVLLPDAILSKLCGSNGGGSGNTSEEAIGHALDEIIERYVKYKIIYENLTPPNIPKQHIKERCPELYDVIQSIEEGGNLSVFVKDASLGKGFTVLCVIVTDMTEQKYLANFGAHPCFEIALERCLTELFQDHECVDNLLSRDEMVEWRNSTLSEIRGLNNWVSLLRDDIGVLPDSIFLEHGSWEFAPWPVYKEYTNKFGMKLQIETLRKNGFDVYIRNNSFLQFPVYKVYVPFASLSHLIFDNSLIEETKLVNSMFDYLENGITKENETLLNKYCFRQNAFLLDMTLKYWNNESKDLLYASVLFDIGKLDEALWALRNIETYEGIFLRKYIELTINCRNNRDALLRIFFKDIETWLSELSKANAFGIFQEYCRKNGLIKSKNSEYGNAHVARDNLYKIVKEAFSHEKIKQIDTREIINGA